MTDAITPSDPLLQLIARQRAAREAARTSPPPGYARPRAGTPQYAADWRAGWITDEQAFADLEVQSERRHRARESVGQTSPAPTRWSRSAPRESRQYANQMTTTAARDNRLTPQAKALLQVIRARCGRGTETRTTKTTLADIMSRHVRSIQRYIAELVRFGYIKATVRRGKSGLYTGLIIHITEKVTPFFAQFEALAAWLAGQPDAEQTVQIRRFSEETGLSPKNHHTNSYSLFPRRHSPESAF